MKSEILLKGIVRTPLFPINKIKELSNQSLLKITEDSRFIEAIENSSPEFLREINKIQEDKSVDESTLENFYGSLYKYFVRSSTRCTPFGILGTVGYVDLAECDTDEKTVLNSEIDKHIRLDPRCFQLIIDYFNFKLKYKISYTKNNSIYNFGNNEFRYFERKRTKDDIYYELSKIFSNEVTNKVIDYFKTFNNYIGFKSIWEIDPDVSEEDITTFFDEIIDSNLIISELEFCTKKNDYLEVLIDKIKNYSDAINISSELNILTEISKLLKDQNKSINTIYSELKELLLSLNIDINEKDLVHIDSLRRINTTIQINSKLRNDLIDLKNTLLKLFPLKNDTFRKFITDYKRRYEDRIMPLLNVLDPETGIGFNSSVDDEDLPLNFERTNNTGSVELNKTEVFLFNKLRSLTEDQNEILIDNSELIGFGEHNSNSLSESMTIFISLLENQKILFNSISGSSGINLMSRFAYLDENIYNLCTDIFTHEKKCNDSNLLAEINHIPELKAGNLLFFDSIRDFEIDCHANSDANDDKKIALDDILIRITNYGVIELVSKKNGKRIIPKLSSSINYNRNSIAVYKFLSELQYQTSVKSIQFHWGSLNSLFKNFPRVVYKNIIIYPAIWTIDSIDIQNLIKSKRNFSEEFLSLKSKQSIPDTFYISRDVYDDNKLYIDTRNDISINVLKKELKKYNKCIITECYLDLEDKFCDDQDNNYCHELMIPILNDKINNSSDVILESNKINSSELIFTPGSKWISLKIYLGVKFVDSFLVNELSELIYKLQKSSLISKWFFVRYLDDDFHLRIRFEVINKIDISLILGELHQIFEKHIDTGHIHNVVYDSYKREIERYTPALIEYCESIFHQDSNAVLKYLGNENSFDERLLFALTGVDSYLELFKFEINEKIEVIETVFEHFFAEFGGGKKLLDNLNKLYRDRRRLIENEFVLFNSISETKEYFEILRNRRSNLESILTIESIQKAKKQKDVIFSLLHMFLNRVFESNPRKKELVVYFFLLKYYKSIKHRKLAENDLEQDKLIQL